MKENITRITVCPKCGKPYTGVPALSRADNETLICPDCGILESLAALGISQAEREQILDIIHRCEGNTHNFTEN